MVLKKCFIVIKHNLLILIAIPLICMIISVIISLFFIKPEYKTEVSIIIERNQISSKDYPEESNNNMALYQRIANNCSEIIKSRTLAENVIYDLDLNMKVTDFNQNLSVVQKKDTALITVTIKSDDPEKAVKIANKLIYSLKKLSIKFWQEDYIKVLDNAELPKANFNSSRILCIFLGVIISILLSLIALFFRSKKAKAS